MREKAKTRDVEHAELLWATVEHRDSLRDLVGDWFEEIAVAFAQQGRSWAAEDLAERLDEIMYRPHLYLMDEEPDDGRG